MTLAPAQRSIRLRLLALAVIALANGIADGLARLGVGAPGALANATALHGALMFPHARAIAAASLGKQHPS
jgi:hypothetical protein